MKKEDISVLIAKELLRKNIITAWQFGEAISVIHWQLSKLKDNK